MTSLETFAAEVLRLATPIAAVIIRKLVPLTASLTLLIASPVFAASHHRPRVDDLSAPTYERQLTPSHNHQSDPYFGLWVQGYPQPDRAA